MDKNNQVILRGTFEESKEFDHKYYGEKFYRIFLNVLRTSGTIDRIPVLVSERLVDLKAYMGKRVQVKGEFRSYRSKMEADGKRHLKLFVFAQEIEDVQEELYDDDVNEVILDAYTCKDAIYRTTPLDREIADMLLAVNRKFSKSDYIPCIAWGRTAKAASHFPIGTHVVVGGRIQSREYQKLGETREAYEVSISQLKVVEE